MPKFIVLRLHPDKPVTGQEFAAYLAGLAIEAFDASFGSPTGEGTPLLGTISIEQHEFEPPPPNVPAAIATAAIKLPSQAPKEYGEPDLILHIKRAGKIIRKVPVDYNVAVAESVNQNPDIQTLEPVAAYVMLPDPKLEAKPDDAIVELPQDGSPPNFGQLLQAVQKVLLKDPGALGELAALTPAKCQHIAHEIVWNRHVAPLPEASNKALAEMYTVPVGTSGVDQQHANARAQFEGTLAQYRALHEADAMVLAKYIFALSAAIACEDKSAQAARAGLRFPIQLGPNQSGKVQEAEVVLEN